MSILDWFAQNPGVGQTSILGTALTATGQSLIGSALANKGIEEQGSANFKADQLRQNAGQQIAVAQQQALDVQHQTDLITSRALAVAAAGGGGASDPTVINIIARDAGEGAYRQALALYGGQEKSRQMNLQADATEYTGAMARENADSTAQATKLGVAATILKGGSSLYSKFSGGGPNNKASGLYGGGGIDGDIA